MPPLGGYLFVSAALFSIGLYGALARRNAVAILMGIELMLNAAALNFVAFWRHINPAATLAGQSFTIFIITLAAAEVAVGLALIIAIYRNRDTVVVDDVDMLKG